VNLPTQIGQSLPQAHPILLLSNITSVHAWLPRRRRSFTTDTTLKRAGSSRCKMDGSFCFPRHAKRKPDRAQPQVKELDGCFPSALQPNLYWP
jgi:hypothetical protein